MFRALVLLLLLPLLLLPPGMCICQFVPIGKASPVPTSAPRATVGQAAEPRPDCTCDSCHRSQAAAAPERGDDRPTQPPGGPAPVPAKHWPGCPAAIGDMPLNMAVPPVKVQVDLTATADFLTTVAEAVVSLDRTTPVSPPVGTPPLFISHCALLI